MFGDFTAKTNTTCERIKLRKKSGDRGQEGDICMRDFWGWGGLEGGKFNVLS